MFAQEVDQVSALHLRTLSDLRFMYSKESFQQIEWGAFNISLLLCELHHVICSPYFWTREERLQCHDKMDFPCHFDQGKISNRVPKAKMTENTARHLVPPVKQAFAERGVSCGSHYHRSVWLSSLLSCERNQGVESNLLFI